MEMGVIDFHIHPVISISSILAEMDRAGVESGVLLGLDLSTDPLSRRSVRKRLRERFYSSSWLAYRPELWRIFPAGESVEEAVRRFFEMLRGSYPEAKVSNREVAELAEMSRGRLVAFGSVNIGMGSRYVREKLREIEELSLRGIKVLPTLQFFNPAEDKAFKLVLEYCEKNRKILAYHTGCDPGPFEIPDLAEDANPRYLMEVLEEYTPTVVLTHMGSYSAVAPGIWFHEALDVMRKFDFVYADMAAVTGFILKREVASEIRSTVGFDRVLFGSDYPILIGSSMAGEVLAVREASSLTPTEKEMVLELNAKRLLNL